MFERCGYYDTVDQAVHWDVYIHIRVPGIQSAYGSFFLNICILNFLNV